MEGQPLKQKQALGLSLEKKDILDEPLSATGSAGITLINKKMNYLIMLLDHTNIWSAREDPQSPLIQENRRPIKVGPLLQGILALYVYIEIY